MADYSGSDLGNERSSRHASGEAVRFEGEQHTLESAARPPYAPSLMSHPALGTRGNASVRAAAMQQAQRTYGNRAVQRAVNPKGRSTVAVQRSAPMSISQRLRMLDDPSYDPVEEEERARQAADEQADNQSVTTATAHAEAAAILGSGVGGDIKGDTDSADSNPDAELPWLMNPIDQATIAARQGTSAGSSIAGDADPNARSPMDQIADSGTLGLGVEAGIQPWW